MAVRVRHQLDLKISRDVAGEIVILEEDGTETIRVIDAYQEANGNTFSIEPGITESVSFGDVGGVRGAYVEVSAAANLFVNGDTTPIALVPAGGINDSAKFFVEGEIDSLSIQNPGLATITGLASVWGLSEGDSGGSSPVGPSSGGGFVYLAGVVGRNGVTISNQVTEGGLIVQSFTASGTDITLTVRAAYPRVTVNGVESVLTDQGGYFEGNIDVTATEGDTTLQVIDSDGKPGALDTFTTALQLPPVIQTAVFTGGYPGAQTELAAGDTFDLQVTADRAFDLVRLADAGAFNAADIPVTSGTSATITGAIADRGDSVQSLGATVQVRDAVTGAFSTAFLTDSAGSVDGVNTVQLNNIAPAPALGAITYPAGQGALKGSEQASVVFTEASGSADTFAFDSPNGQLSIANPTLSEASKTVTRIAGGTNETIANLRVIATRSQNGRSIQATRVVFIQNVAPTINLSLPAARLRSGGNDGTSPQNYTLSLSSNQQLASAPTLNTDSGGQRGTFTGAFTGSGSSWSRTIRVDETIPDEKGVFAFENLSATNLAGLTQTSINSGESYELGGFVPRTLTVAAFANTVNANVETVDFAKVTANSFSPGGTASKQPIGTPFAVDNERPNQYTITATGVSPTVVRLLDTAAVNANSLGLYNLSNFQETV